MATATTRRPARRAPRRDQEREAAVAGDQAQRAARRVTPPRVDVVAAVALQDHARGARRG
jgi:hypothetical protein